MTQPGNQNPVLAHAEPVRMTPVLEPKPGWGHLVELSLTSGACPATSYPNFTAPNYFLVWEDLENVLELFIQPLQFPLVFINMRM